MAGVILGVIAVLVILILAGVIGPGANKPSAPVAVVDVCNNVEGAQSVIPNGMVSDGRGGCVVPTPQRQATTPPAPQPTQAPPPPPTSAPAPSAPAPTQAPPPPAPTQAPPAKPAAD